MNEASRTIFNSGESGMESIPSAALYQFCILRLHRDAASSIPVSNGMVSSTMWTEEAFQTTMSGRLLVTAMFWGKVYGLLGRSTLVLLPWGKYEERKEWMQVRTLVMPVIVSPLRQGHLAVVQHIVQRLLLAAELAPRGWHLLPQEQVLVVWQCVSDSIQGKLEDALWEILHGGRPEVCWFTGEVAH